MNKEMSREIDRVRKRGKVSKVDKREQVDNMSPGLPVTTNARNGSAVAEVIESRDLAAPPMEFFSLGGLFTIRYSSTEIFSEGGDLHVKMKETRYRDGRITSEECEGTVDRQAVDRMTDQLQGYFMDQATGFMRMLCAPFFGGDRRDKD